MNLWSAVEHICKHPVHVAHALACEMCDVCAAHYQFYLSITSVISSSRILGQQLAVARA